MKSELRNMVETGDPADGAKLIMLAVLVPVSLVSVFVLFDIALAEPTRKPDGLGLLLPDFYESYQANRERQWNRFFFGWFQDMYFGDWIRQTPSR